VFSIAGEDYRFYNAVEPSHLTWATAARHGHWEEAEFQFLAETLRPGDTVLDVGAWVGSHAMVAARSVAPGGVVYAFEPDPVARGHLVANLSGNAIGNVEVVPQAVGDSAGVVYLADGRLGSSKSTVSRVKTGEAVEATTLGDFCTERSLWPAFIKVDVEGAEADVLAGAPDFILRTARALMIELHSDELAARGIRWQELVAGLERLGFEPTGLERRSDRNFTVGFRAFGPRRGS
jgi:FkbM family methyltransferase